MIEETDLGVFLEKHRKRIESIPPPWTNLGEDLYQTVCVACLERWRHYDSWTTALVMTIARNRWHDLQRKERIRSHEPFDDDFILATDECPQIQLEFAERDRMLARGIEKLRPEHSFAIKARYWDEKSCRQIAIETNQKLEAVKSQCKRGVVALGRILGPRATELGFPT